MQMFTQPTFQVDYQSTPSNIGIELDAIQLSIFSHRFMSIAEQMGRCVHYMTHYLHQLVNYEYSIILIFNFMLLF